MRLFNLANNASIIPWGTITSILLPKSFHEPISMPLACFNDFSSFNSVSSSSSFWSIIITWESFHPRPSSITDDASILLVLSRAWWVSSGVPYITFSCPSLVYITKGNVSLSLDVRQTS